MGSHPSVLITGAGSGLGRALARRYAAAGWRVGSVDLDGDRAEETLGLLQGPASHAAHRAWQADVGDDASMQRLCEAVQTDWGAPDVLINNAGVSSAGTLLATPIEDWQWMLNINLLGVVRGCRLFGPAMQARGSGRIINIASFAGIAGAPGLAAYSTAKAAVVALSESLRAELEPSGVGVSVVCPSFFQTNLLENFRTPDPRLKDIAAKLMQRARESADDIAAEVFRQSQRGHFMILPSAEPKRYWRLKRWFPELYFRLLRRLRPIAQ